MPTTISPTSPAVETLRALADAYGQGPVDSVAVVGNAPVPPDEERARLIDASDLVIRINGFALDRTAPAVGRRCDVVVFTRGVQATPWFLKDYRERLYLLVEPGRLHWEPETSPDWWPADLGWIPVPNRDVILPLSDRLGLPTAVEPRWATTGTVGIWLAHLLYPRARLRLAGFSFIDNPLQTRWEHATGDPCAISPEHALSSEQGFVFSLVSESAGLVTVHR